MTRYRHRFCNTQFGDLTLSPQALAVLCELFLRGPQTPGELRSRARRMAPLANVSEVDTVLADLAARDEPLVMQLPREPGRREARWAHLFGAEPPASAPQTPADPEPMATRGEDSHAPSALPEDSLRNELDRLRADVDELRARLEALEHPR